MVQAAGFALRISCATPALAPALGMAGIGFSSMLAGEASRRFGANLRGESMYRSNRDRVRDAALDAIMGITLFKVCNSLLLPLSLERFQRASSSIKPVFTVFHQC